MKLLILLFVVALSGCNKKKVAAPVDAGVDADANVSEVESQ